MVAPEGMVGDSMEVVQSASVGGKGRVADAGEGGEGSSSKMTSSLSALPERIPAGWYESAISATRKHHILLTT